MKDLRNLPKAPRRFQVVDENTWIGSPSVPYGIIRRLAYEQRRSQRIPYLRILFGEAGRRGDPWGGLALEVNGDLFHFSAGVKRWPHLHDGAGNLTSEGQQALAHGVRGLLLTSCDWRWVQDEVDVTSLLNDAAIKQIARYFHHIIGVMFQSRVWAKRWNVEIEPYYYNCTTIILEQIKRASGLIVEESMPLPAFDALCQLVSASRSELDDELNYFLSLPEQRVSDLLQEATESSWDGFAKGQTQLSHWLTWESLPKRRVVRGR